MGMTCWKHEYDGPNACRECLTEIIEKIDSKTLTEEDYPLVKELLSWA